MLKKVIKYTDYDGNERTMTAYFNLSKAELMEMELNTSGGMQQMLNNIVEAQDTKRLVELFKDIILRSYGEKSPDGMRFIKVKDGVRLAEGFSETEAYSELFMELATNDRAAAEFINGIIPQSLAEQVAQEKATAALASVE